MDKEPKVVRLRGTIRAMQRTKIKTDQARRAIAKSKEKLRSTAQVDDESVSDSASKQGTELIDDSRILANRTINQRYRRRRKKRQEAERSSNKQAASGQTTSPPAAHGNEMQPDASAFADTYFGSEAGSHNNPFAISERRIGKSTVQQSAEILQPVASGSASPVLRSPVTAVQQHLQRQKVIREAERKAHASLAAKISTQIRKRAANAARKASKAAIDETKAMVSLVAGGGAVAMIIIVVVILFGCSIALFGSGNGSSYTPVSAEVNAYEPLIRHYAALHQIPEYVELIKAVMMQESGGRGNDPMQASECGYNQRFPRTPNGITDPEYSINVGVRELAECLRLAEVDSPLDMDRIRLALQGYNYGEGYISWAKARGGYTALSAKEYSDMMAARNHWESYGDINYVNHVLQYYPFGHAFLPGGNQMLVEVARSQLGNIGGDPYWSWYGFDSRVEWCACFVSWCCDQCGYIESEVVPKYSYCPTGADWFKERNQWAERDITPQPGMIIFFDWARGGRQNGETDHTGIVEKVENGRVYTIEGNSGNACREKSYPIGWYEIYGYGTF